MMRNVFGGSQKQEVSFFIKIIRKLEPMYRRMGVDYPIMEKIIDTKLTMDSRQEKVIPTNSMWGNSKEEDKDKNAFFQSLWVYALISLILLFVFAIDDIQFQYTVFFSFIFVMLLSTLIANFSSILLETKDQLLIGTKPVSSRTLSAAKATHVFIYLISLTLALSGPMMIGTFFIHGILAGLLAVLLTITASTWCLLLTIITYATVLKRFNGEKLKNIIAYSQIGISVFTIIGYQVMNQAFRFINPSMLAIELNLQWWHIFVFPLWFVAPFGLLQNGFSLTYLMYIVLLVGGTIGLIVLYHFNSDKLEANLQKLESGEGDTDKRSWYETFSSKWLCWDKKERGYYHFTWQLTKNEREFKTRLYPSLATIFIFPIVLIGSTYQLTEDSGVGINQLSVFKYMPYYALLIIPMLAVSVKYSKNFKGSWIFGMSSEDNAGVFLRGMIKALIMKLVFPIYLILSGVVLVFSGFEILPALLNGLLLVVLIFSVEVKRTIQTYPFSKKYNASEANQGCFATVIFIGITGIVAVGMFAIQELVPFGVYLLMVILLAVDGWMLTRGFNKIKLKMD
ncbi:hypothetical protein VXN63_09800 [Marinilactibacillus sp. XAAS-LB27]|uniref:hypothetical protein n=1 Tax=Marinilactibacillus sp. XAAS-LB27 TaxID=3114538 RepID=UPI002E19FF53|nr:hypothetical protein [Marinilactibacillus sp. XAAS-LB27]